VVSFCLGFNTFFANSILYGVGGLQVSELFASFNLKSGVRSVIPTLRIPGIEEFEKQYKYPYVIFSYIIVILIFFIKYKNSFLSCTPSIYYTIIILGNHTTSVIVGYIDIWLNSAAT
jgi:hypothetical protein